MEIYIDDIVVKSSSTVDHLTKLEETFRVLAYVGMKLNPTKSFFRLFGGGEGFKVHFIREGHINPFIEV
jgi:hypothetical protein